MPAESESINPLLEVLLQPIEEFLDSKLDCHRVIQSKISDEGDFVGYTGYLKPKIIVRITVTAN